jgi:hypothetical protein
MWILVLMFLLAVPAWAEDLGELSANLTGLSGWSGLSGLSGSFDRFAGPANKTDQIDQINEIDQFRLSVLAGLDQQSLRRRESLQPQESHESLRPRPAN